MKYFERFLLLSVMACLLAGCGIASGPLELPAAVVSGVAWAPEDEPPIVRDSKGGFAPSASVQNSSAPTVIYRGSSN